MKSPNRKTVAKLTALPNVGPAVAADLELLGINQPQQLIGQDPYQLHERLCELTAIRHDPCVIDVFISIIDFMEGGEAAPWWTFTPQRKAHLSG